MQFFVLGKFSLSKVLPYKFITFFKLRGGGLKVPPTLFLFVKAIEKVIRLCTVMKKKHFLSCGCEDRPILWAFFTNLSLETIYLSPELLEKWLYF